MRPKSRGRAHDRRTKGGTEPGPTANAAKAAWLTVIVGHTNMNTFKLSHADGIIAAALVGARQKRLSPVVVAVLDAGGHLVAFKREDGAGFLRFDIAYGKAWGALGLGFGTREVAERAPKLPVFYAALSATSQGRVIPSPGGVLIAGADGDVIGAVGISGDIGDNDEACALAGIKAVGLTAIPGSKGQS